MYYQSIFILFIGILFSVDVAFAQCDGQRFYDAVFEDVDASFAINFGEAPQPTFFNPNAMQQLDLDFYEPAGDTLTARPLIIWAFGGSFVAGTRLSPDIVQLCNYFSRLGYVNASIDYRLSTDLLWDNSTENAYNAVRKSMSDMKAAVRFFYKDALTDNDYRVDTTRIYVGGVSAGAIAAVHLAYLNEESEVPPEVFQDFADNGFFEGNSGNLGYGSDIAGVVNLSGGIRDTAWIIDGDVPIVSMHGTEDDVVPYGTEIITTLGVNLPFNGSASIHAKMDQLDIENAFFTWPGAGHTPFAFDDAYMDTTQWFVRDFLYDQICESLTSHNTLSPESWDVNLSPNPSNGWSVIRHEDITPDFRLEMYDAIGRESFPLKEYHQGQISFDGGFLPTGIYHLVLKDDKGIPLWRGKWLRL